MKFITYGAYVWLPVIATLSWLVTLLGLLLLWLIRDDHKKYGSREATVVFISDVGGAHQELFIPGCVIVFVSYTLTLCAERWLRHVERIPGVLRRRDRFWGITTIITGFLGGFSLMMLSILNTFEHPTVHWSFTLLFILLVGASSVSQTIEIIYLQKGHPDRPHLKRNALMKAFIVGIAIAVAIVFGILYLTCRGKATSPRCNVIISAAGICEWLVSTILIFYFMTFILDLWPAAKTSPRHQRRADWKLAKKLDLAEKIEFGNKEKIDPVEEEQDRQDQQDQIHSQATVIQVNSDEQNQYTIEDPCTLR